MRHSPFENADLRYLRKLRISLGIPTRMWIFCLICAASGLSSIRCEAQPAQTSSSVSENAASVSTAENAEASSGSVSTQTAPRTYKNGLGLDLVQNLASDQKTIWTSPSRLRLADADWLLPFGVATGILFATDTEFSKHLSNSPSLLNHSSSFSNYGVASLAAASGGLYVLGRFTHDERKRETGLLAAEAAMNSLAVNYALKYSFERERPLEDNYRGPFFQGGGDSFPSIHSAVAWSTASVIAHEYPGTLPTILSYGLAAAISASRVSAKQHYSSDVLVGSAIGWLVGEEIYRHHHNAELGGRNWETYPEARDREPGRKPTAVASAYVELDSWIYPAIERLVALGYIHSEFIGIRPWTRLECAEMVEEAGDSLRAESGSADEAGQIYGELVGEFERDLAGAGNGGPASFNLESVYSHVTYITGPPLADSYHFGQTVIDNFGRPYEQGLNSYDGASAYATVGRFAVYVRGEYEHAPFAPAYSLPAREAIAATDDNPLQPAVPFNTANQFSLLDTYVTAKFSAWNISFGKQTLWWGPEDEGSLMLSDNAAPMYMFRAAPEESLEIPLLSRFLGRFKTDFFVGKLSGNQFPARPLIHGEKISFKPTQNLEIGFSRLVEFGGAGRPLTAGAIWNSYASVKSSVNYRAAVSPGKRTSGFDVSYRLPFVRNWASVYADSLGADEVTPLANPPRSALNTGIYLPRLPGIRRLDLRVEAGYTDATTSRSNNGEYVYWDLYYHDLSTNKGNLIGSWMGREGKGVGAVSTYSFSARNNIQFAYREAKVSKDFIPSGETINDASMTVNRWLFDVVSLSASVQYEKWLAPVLAVDPQTDWTSSIRVTFWPKKLT